MQRIKYGVGKPTPFLKRSRSDTSYLMTEIRRSHDLTSPDFDVFCTEYDVKWRMKIVSLTGGSTEQSPFFGTPKSLY